MSDGIAQIDIAGKGRSGLRPSALERARFGARRALWSRRAAASYAAVRKTLPLTSQPIDDEEVDLRYITGAP